MPNEKGELTEEEKFLLRPDTKMGVMPAQYMPDFLLRAFRDLDRYFTTVSSSSSAVVEQLEKAETLLAQTAGTEQASAKNDAQTQQMLLVRDDVEAALREARASQQGVRVMQAEVKKLREAFDDSSSAVLRARIQELENLVERHIANHER